MAPIEMDYDLVSSTRSKSEALLDCPSTQFQLSSLPTLVKYLDYQVHDVNLYSLSNNVGILKIYLLYPNEADVLVIQKILALSLTQVPSPDFTVCLAQIPLYHHTKEPVAKLLNLNSLLQNCMFLRFWEEAKVPLESLDGMSVLDVSGVCESVRKFILDVLPLVYHQMSVSEVRKLLNFTSNSQEFEDIMTSCGWTFDATYDKNDENSGFCYSVSRDDNSKSQKSSAKLNPLEKYLKSEPMKYYYNTLHN